MSRLERVLKRQVAARASAANPRGSFWAQYRRKPYGMIGLTIIVVYILAAIFADKLTPYDPLKDLYLADRLAAPSWIGAIMPKYRGAPPTIRKTVESHQWRLEGPPGASVSTKTIDDERLTAIEIPAMAEGSYEPVTVSIHFPLKYTWNPPLTFYGETEYRVHAPFDAMTSLKFEVVDPTGRRWDMWGTSVYGELDPTYLRIDTRDLGVKTRLGIWFFDEPSKQIFASHGQYDLVFTISAESSEPVTVYLEPVKLGILGVLHGVLGADHLGSDLWSQLLYGARISLLIGLSSAFISVLIGTSLGIMAGYIGGAFDDFLMRVVDVLLAIPTLPILIILGSLLGKNIWNVVILIAVFAWMGTARVVRSQTLTLKERTFVEAAKASGASHWYVMAVHILPNVLPMVFAALVLRIPTAILFEASLSFLGLGDPRVATWGRMLQNARGFGAFTHLAWWWLLPPGFALTFLSLAFVFIGNTVNEIFNPRYRERS